MSGMTFDQAVDAIVAVGRAFDARGWAPATSGNYSARLSDGSIAITVSGRHKGRLDPTGIMTLSPDGTPQLAAGRPSAEAGLHLALYRWSPRVGAVLHSHSPAAVALTRATRGDRWTVRGHELLKALPGIATHDTEVSIPIVENSQDIGSIAQAVMQRLSVDAPPAYLIRGHGLYGWGADVDEAERVVEAVEWLIAAELAERQFRGSE